MGSAILVFMSATIHVLILFTFIHNSKSLAKTETLTAHISELIAKKKNKNKKQTKNV